MSEQINRVEGHGRLTLDLMKEYGIGKPRQTVYRNASKAFLVEMALKHEPDDSAITSTGALAVLSGAKTGRSPADKRIVETPESKDDVNWESSACIPLSQRSFDINKQRAKDYLSTCDRLYVVDAYAGHDPKLRVRVRVVCSRAYHAFFCSTMFVQIKDPQELDGFEPDITVFNAGCFPANPLTEGMSSNVSVDFHLERKEVVIAGTQYAGEQKKGVLTFMMYMMPLLGHLPMHASANMSRGDDASVSVFFGLSGTGKTTLSADEGRILIGDDEIIWMEHGVQNVEGGVYQKLIDLTPESEPLLYNAVKWGSVVENVVFDPHTREIDYHDTSITMNTRAACPLSHIPNSIEPAVGGVPTNVVFLTYDCFGVLPPVSRLSPAQAQMQFMSGFTSKVAGTEMGVTEPQATFSACFGEAFLVLHPSRYAELLAEKMRRHSVPVWLINTGLVGGGHGKGHRCPLKYTRAIIDAIHDGSLAAAPTKKLPVFDVDVPQECKGVPPEILNPSASWDDKAAYDASLRKLGGLFVKNFEKYRAKTSEEVLAALPKV